MGGACGKNGERVWVGKLEGNRPPGRHKRRWEDNMKMDIQGVGWGAMTGFIWLGIWTGGGLL